MTYHFGFLDHRQKDIGLH